MPDIQSERFSQTKVQEELLEAEETQQVWEAFWDGENGLKHLGRAMWVDIDEPEDLKLADLESLSLDGRGVNGLSNSVRSEVYSVLRMAEEFGGERAKKYVEKMYMSGVGPELHVFEYSALDLDFLQSMVKGSERADEIGGSIDYLRLDILKSTTLFAILDSCQNFDECLECFEQWERLLGFRDFMSVHLFTLWLEKANSWEEKRAVLMKAKEYGLDCNEDFVEAIFEGIYGRENRMRVARTLLDDEDLGETYRDKDFFNGWVRLERTHIAKVSIIRDEMPKYGVDISAFSLLAGLVNLENKSEVFGVLRSYFERPVIRSEITRPEFMHYLFSEDCFSFKEKIQLLNLYKEQGENPDEETLEYIYGNENDLETLRNGLEVLVTIYRRVFGIQVPEGLLKKVFQLSLKGDSIDEMVRTCRELNRLGIRYGRDDVKYNYKIPDCVRIVNDEECLKDFPYLVMEAVVRLMVHRYDDDGVPGDDLLGAVESLSTDLKKEMRGLIEKFFANQDVDIEEEYRYYLIGVDVLYSPLEGGEERNFWPWLEFYGKTRVVDANLRLDLYKLRWEEGEKVPEDLKAEFKGVGVKDVARLLKGLEEYFGVDGRPEISEVEHEDWQGLFKYLRKRSAKKKGKGGHRRRGGRG